MLAFTNMPRQDFTETYFGFIWISDGILYIQYKPVVIEAQVVNEVINHKLKICKGQNFPLLVDACLIKYWTLEARKVSYYHKDSFTNLTASALVNSTPVANTLVNWCFKFMKSPIPVKLFSEFSQGVNWLQQFK